MKQGQFIIEGIVMALRALRSHRLRALLTIFGVATGIFAITGILTLVYSMQTTLTEKISALGNTTMFVHHVPWTEDRADWYKFRNRPPITYADFSYASSRLDRLDGMSFEISVSDKTLQAEGRSVSGVSVVGATHDLILARPLELYAGRYFSDIESHLGRPVCLMGYSIATALFPDQNPVGQYVRIGKNRMLIIGVIDKQGANLFGGGSDDEKVYIPYETLAKLYDTQHKYGIMIIRADAYENVTLVSENLRAIMRAGRSLKPSVEDNFAINQQEALMERFDSFFNYLEWGGTVISIFSILIGGFSIGNIMYISVRERTQEIGVQKALGATRGFVLFQFLAEAICLCLIGGIVGILLTFLLGSLIQAVLSGLALPFTVSYSPWHMLYGLGIAFLIGLVAGILPAGTAASLDPVVAIRKN